VRTLRAVALTLAACLALGACGSSGLVFTQDSTLDVLSPAPRAKVHLPVEIRWRTTGGAAGANGPYFAVFLDRAPVRPGQSLRAVADDTCNRTPGCPDAAYLRDREVFVTKGTSVTVDAVPKHTGQRTGANDEHEAVIIPVDAQGRRIGEVAHTVQFTVKGR
jgi:hypothetical protein